MLLLSDHGDGFILGVGCHLGLGVGWESALDHGGWLCSKENQAVTFLFMMDEHE